jgi:glucosylglycerate synthase
MATVDPIPDLTPQPAQSGYALLVLLAPLSPEQLEATIGRLAGLFPAEDLLVATQNGFAPESWPGLHVVTAPTTNTTWTLTAADFANAAQLAREHDARNVLVLGPEAGSLSPAALRQLTNSVLDGSADLALPHYALPPNVGLVNSAILYPLTRALFATRARYPLAVDMGFSQRMAERLGAAAQRFMNLGQNDALLWPIPEAVIGGCTIEEFDVGSRAMPQPPDPDIRTILVQITSSLFSDIESKAAYWQRARRLPPSRVGIPPQAATDRSSEVGSLVESYRLAYNNLQELWSLVLPPNSLVGLKRLFVLDPAHFRMPDNLWARIVYDFLVAYRLRSINRGHLLGALIPLYLAWVASHINITTSGIDPERHIEAVAAAFDADKPYLVSRWRWPDRFNP